MTEQNKKIIELMKHIGVVDEATLQERLKKAYYEGEPLITDAEYDELFGDKDYVGYTPEQNGPWEVLDHRIAMGSLSKLKTWEQAQNWLKDKGHVVWEPKLDGLSIEIVYEYGLPTHAILRGGGDKGEDILKNAINFKNVPQKIDAGTLPYVSVRGEVVIKQSDFDQLGQTFGADYSNRRNCVPGICRRYDGRYSDFLSFYAYDIVEIVNDAEDKKDYSTELEKLTTLYNYGFKLPFAYNTMTEEDYMKYGDIRDTAEEFQMDGLVIKTMDMKHQIALKFEPKGETTTVTGYTWELGTTGKYVPTIWFEKVNVGGSNLTKAAIGSFQGYNDLHATIGSVVEVRKMGDVIPKVTRVIVHNEKEVLGIPLYCPKCGKVFERQGADLYCTNPVCPTKIAHRCCAVYWAVPIKGVTTNWLEQLIDEGKVKCPADVIKVKAEDIANIKGFSIDRATKIIETLRESWKNLIVNDDIEHLLWAMPIPTISGKAYSKLASMFSVVAPVGPTCAVDAIKMFLKEELTDEDKKLLISYLGNAKGTKAYEYFSENRQDILQLIEEMENLL